MVEYTVGDYTYECDPERKSIPEFFIQQDGGDNEPIVRKLVDGHPSLEEIYHVKDKEGYFLLPRTTDMGHEALIPITKTNNPHITKQLS